MYLSTHAAQSLDRTQMSIEPVADRNAAKTLGGYRLSIAQNVNLYLDAEDLQRLIAQGTAALEQGN